jgi:enediyne biosynthesis protein E4
MSPRVVRLSLGAWLACAGCVQDPPPQPSPARGEGGGSAPSKESDKDGKPFPIRFHDIAAEAGVAFRFQNGSRGKHDLPEIMGGGLGWIDVDGDGRLDLYFCNGGPIEPGQHDPPGALFRNRGGGKFEALADSPPGPPYAMGCAVGDYDGDGRDDLFVTGWRGQRLYRNQGEGKFADVTDRAGLASDLWTTSAAFADLDGDGDLDLFVAAYLEYDPATAPFVAAPDGRRDFAGPESFPAQPDRLYRNNGDGTFTDVSRSAGVDRPDGRGLGVLIADLVGDAKLDIYVANDGTACSLFENKGDLKFEEVALRVGVAFNGNGDRIAGMGIALGDLDGLESLLVTNFLDRSTIAFAGSSRGVYLDATSRLGLDLATRNVNGFGLALADFDGDGLLDLVQANGHVLDRERLGVPFAMRPTLLRNNGRRLIDVSTSAGPAFARPVLGRGLALGDFDDDGRPDVAIACLDSPALLLRNVTEAPPGLTLELVGTPPSNPAPIGAIVRATVGARTLVRRVVGGGSYLAASDRRVHLGLGSAARVDRLDVAWPSGRREVWTNVPGGRRLRLVEGTGVPP